MEIGFGVFTRSLYIALADPCFSRSLLNNDWAQFWHPDNPTMGHCAAASEALYFVAGGPLRGLKPWVASYAENGRRATHWWLTGPGGRIWDPTVDQFLSVGCLPPYRRVGFEQGFEARIAPCGFQGQRKLSENDPDLWGFGRKPGKRASQLLSHPAFSVPVVMAA